MTAHIETIHAGAETLEALMARGRASQQARSPKKTKAADSAGRRPSPKPDPFAVEIAARKLVAAGKGLASPPGSPLETAQAILAAIAHQPAVEAPASLPAAPYVDSRDGGRW
jgi:hypothetical protein